jgi:hypothetical protein
MAEAWGAPHRAAPDVMNITARTDVILNIGDSLKFPSSVGSDFDRPSRQNLDLKGLFLDISCLVARLRLRLD